MGAATVVPSLEAIHTHIGKPLGLSDWVEITQERVDAFADATGDQQWIHVDVERARRESPWGGTIAHGYLTLSLAPVLMAQLVEVRGCRALINTGIEKLRLRAPIPVGSRVRMGATLQNARTMPGGGVRVAVAVHFEVEGEPKPAAQATVVLAYLP